MKKEKEKKKYEPKLAVKGSYADITKILAKAPKPKSDKKDEKK